MTRDGSPAAQAHRWVVRIGGPLVDSGLSVVDALRSRADAYGRDAEALRHRGDTDDAVLYEAIRDELRRLAEQMEEAA